MTRYFLAGLIFVGSSWAWEKASAQEIRTTDTSQTESPKTKTNKPPKAKRQIKRGIKWLVAAQQANGGWGAGSHAHQEIRDPNAVPTDPATTAFAATALLKAGHTPTSGDYQDAVRQATENLVATVEAAEPKNAKITSLSGTQPQRKLGEMIDTAMTAQFLTRVAEHLPQNDPLAKRVEAALSECLERLERTQQKDGSWQGGGGWAPVLQSAMNCNSLEMALATGRKVDASKLKAAKQYQKSSINIDSGAAMSGASGGVELYAFAGGLRGNAGDAAEAQQAVESAKAAGKLEEDAPVNEQSLRIAGVSEIRAKELGDATAQNQSQLRRLSDEQLLAGFGNNGGEEFLSYLMTSESLVIAGGEAWDKWNKNMTSRLGKVQNQDGSWSGHHCITSPVFCTAAALQVLLTEKDVDLLRKIAKLKDSTSNDDDEPAQGK
ncbi:hypothetical protein Pla22_07870 [Rubripirellula amarantea]|uniref:Squalene cyclase C-terminal domain-containing protein n=1 Tax=Rubripirellula amarantea TaxID=2527999 RepID=A0A5C5WSM5_9BACT|nr:hypothetical protein [Rubripirellula amarantea]TWT53159.1 hypothetical protein Pla22_07870 [Rubripirellula amarantea]